MSTLKTNAAQIGQSVTATNNFTLYQPTTPDGTVRLGVGNAGSVTDLLTINNSGNLALGTTTLQSGGGAAKWLTLNSSAGYTGGIAYTINNTVQMWEYQDNDNMFYFQGTGSNAGFKFSRGGAEIARITTSGIQAVGSTSQFIPTPAGIKNMGDGLGADSCIPTVGNSFGAYTTTGASGTGNAPGADGHILGMSWGNTNSYGCQIYVDTDPTNYAAVRTRSNTGVWQSWRSF